MYTRLCRSSFRRPPTGVYLPIPPPPTALHEDHVQSDAEEIAYYQAHADDDLRPNQIVADVVGIVLTLTAVTARVLARLCSRAKFAWDDYLIFVALMGQLSYAVLMFLSIANGEGQHIIFVKSQKLFAQEYVAAMISYSITVMLTKISILCLYHRIFPVKWLMLASYLMGAVVIAYNLAVIFVAAFQCIPLSALWMGNPGKCIDISPPFTALAIVNVVTDVAILALPVQPVLGLQMQRSRKIQVLTIFLLGGIVCIFGVIRAVAIATLESVDISYNAVYSGLWSYIEISVGILAACVPTFGPLFQHRRRRKLGSEPYGSSSGSGSSRRWKLGTGRSKVTQKNDSTLLTEISCPGNPDPDHDHDAWSGSGSGQANHGAMMRPDRHFEGKKVNGFRSSKIIVQKNVHQIVDLV